MYSESGIHHRLVNQLSGNMNRYQHMLDDEFLFAAAVQVPQVATIFDLVEDIPLPFGGMTTTLPGLVAMIAYRYGFLGLSHTGHGGYAVVFGHDTKMPPAAFARSPQELRRVLRLVPDHHVRDVLARQDQSRPFDVRLDERNEPIRNPDYPLLLSDLFLLPRHTTKLCFHGLNGEIAKAGGWPAILHCQLLPEVIPLNGEGLNRQMAERAGNVLEAALATLGVSVADAHGGNGGVLLGRDGKPLLFHRRRSTGQIDAQYIPVVLDYGYYSTISPRHLARILVQHGVTADMMYDLLAKMESTRVLIPELDATDVDLTERLYRIIDQSDLPPHIFGRLLFRIHPRVLVPQIWINRFEQHWRTITEAIYPPLREQSRLTTIYPAYDEILFPQRIETYHLYLS